MFIVVITLVVTVTSAAIVPNGSPLPGVTRGNSSHGGNLTEPSVARIPEEDGDDSREGGAPTTVDAGQPVSEEDWQFVLEDSGEELTDIDVSESDRKNRASQEVLDYEMRKHMNKMKGISKINGTSSNVQFTAGEIMVLSCDFDPRECLHDMRLENSWFVTDGYNTRNNPNKPTTDANLRRSDGRYMYVDLLCPRCRTSAGLQSDVLYQSQSTAYCLRFSYGMTGQNTGHLGAYLIFPNSNRQQRIWNTWSDTGRGWQNIEMVFTSVSSDSAFRLVFLFRYAQRTGIGSVYIDDVHLSQGQSCPQFGGTSSRWDAWGPWSGCTVTCGAGVRQRFRSCLTGNDCVGETFQQETCSRNCMGQWSAWNNWSPCSSSCGTGTMTRSRLCPSGDICVGIKEERGRCFFQSCPSNVGTWSSWEAWSVCDVSCGSGSTSRRRTCTRNGFCNGRDIERGSCYVGACPRLHPWSLWTGCSRSCGDGVQFRARGCVGDFCPGDRSQRRSCNTVNCPASVWSQWVPWSSCSATCGQASQFRTRNCLAGNSPTCRGTSSESQTCDNLPPCGIQEGLWAQWTPWSSCTRSCNRGSQIRYRNCQSGICLGLTEETRACNEFSCPTTSGFWTDWGAWTRCPVTCGTGTRFRTRQCNGDNRGCPGRTFESMQCSVSCGPVPGPSPTETACGRPGPTQIIGGSTAVQGSWPWHVGIFYSSGSQSIYQCGGSLINSRYIVTAAHCGFQKLRGGVNIRISASKFFVLLGDNNLSSGKKFTVAASSPHQGFTFSGVENDIGILKLSEDVKFTNNIKPICLPTRGPKTGESCPVIGWGRTSTSLTASLSFVLKQVTLQVLSRTQCERDWYPNMVGMFCAGTQTPREQNSHGGDSGGSVNCMENGRFTLQGVVSFGDKNFRVTSVYTDVNYYKSWIEAKMAELG